MSRHSGRCRCGRVRFTADAEPDFTAHCHCEDCRKASGAPVLAFVGFEAGQVSFEGETPRTFSTGSARRSFCAHCGAPIAYEDERAPARTYFVLGAMDEPGRFAPTHHSYWPERLPFPDLSGDGLPHHQKTSVPRS